MRQVVTGVGFVGVTQASPGTEPRVVGNAEIADRFDAVADLLEAQRANQFRVQAWRSGAATLRRLGRPVADVLRDEGLAGLERLPAIGSSLARAIRELVESGRLSTLTRLRGAADPLAALASVAGIGHGLAQRIHDALGITTLEELELAAHDGRLADVPGFGEKRVAGVRDVLAERLRRRRQASASAVRGPAAPPVSELLDVDHEYRTRAEMGELPTIAPRRHNPGRLRWLPVLHASRGSRHYTALFSNTANAHRLGRTTDWVVLYYDDHDGERQCTVVTETSGSLAGRRVVRGREEECRVHYARTLA